MKPKLVNPVKAPRYDEVYEQGVAWLNGDPEVTEMTHTYVLLEVSSDVFREIKAKLEAAGYGHAVHDFGRVLDMHGLALVSEIKEEDPTPWCHACGAMLSKDCRCGPIAENE